MLSSNSIFKNEIEQYLEDESELQGIIPYHSYTILEVWEIGMIEGEDKIGMLKMRAPEKGEWTGAWSKSDPAWDNIHPEIAEVLEIAAWKECDDRSFFISWDDYLKRFQWTNKCFCIHPSPAP